jgi:ferrochelatase
MTTSSSNGSKYDSVLLMGYGGPERMDEVRPFLNNVLRGLPVPKERYETVVHHYELIGGKSPLNELTRAQAEGLRQGLIAAGIDIPVYIGMRFAKPYFFTAIREMIAAGDRRAVGLILSPYRSEPSFEKYIETLDEVLNIADPDLAPKIDVVDPWFDHPLFAEAQADQIRKALDQIPESRRDGALLIFTAHSIPTAIADRCPYVAQIETACQNTCSNLGGRGWRLAWQSRSGNPRTPWLEPDVNAILPELKAQGATDIVLCPIGFISDHVEVMYDLDLEAAQTCRNLGLNMVRALSVNDHPVFIQALVDLVRRRVVSA